MDELILFIEDPLIDEKWFRKRFHHVYGSYGNSKNTCTLIEQPDPPSTTEEDLHYMYQHDIAKRYADQLRVTENAVWKHIQLRYVVIRVTDEVVTIQYFVNKQRCRNSKFHMWKIDCIERCHLHSPMLYFLGGNYSKSLFITRESAIQYAITAARDYFSIYAFNVEYISNIVNQNEIQKFIVSNPSVNSCYEYCMRYVGGETVLYNKLGTPICGLWSNLTDKSYYDFIDAESFQYLTTAGCPVLLDARR